MATKFNIKQVVMGVNRRRVLAVARMNLDTYLPKSWKIMTLMKKGKLFKLKKCSVLWRTLYEMVFSL